MPNPGTLYCLGVGPGDPELVTIKAARLLAQVPHLVAPTARIKADSLALSIAKPYLGAHAKIYQHIFPMTSVPTELAAHWDESAAMIDALLLAGDDVCFPTLGDPLTYSTALYLARALRRRRSEAEIQFVPGVTAFSAVAAITQVALGEGKRPLTIVPAADDDLDGIRRALATGGAVVLMKIGHRLGAILELLAQSDALSRAVMVSRAGLPDQQLFPDLTALRAAGASTEYLAVIVIPAPEFP